MTRHQGTGPGRKRDFRGLRSLAAIVGIPLADKVRSSGAAEDRRTDLFEQRCRLVDDWAEYVLGVSLAIRRPNRTAQTLPSARYLPGARLPRETGTQLLTVPRIDASDGEVRCVRGRRAQPRRPRSCGVFRPCGQPLGLPVGWAELREERPAPPSGGQAGAVRLLPYENRR